MNVLIDCDLLPPLGDTSSSPSNFPNGEHVSFPTQHSPVLPSDVQFLLTAASFSPCASPGLNRSPWLLPFLTPPYHTPHESPGLRATRSPRRRQPLPLVQKQLSPAERRLLAHVTWRWDAQAGPEPVGPDTAPTTAPPGQVLLEDSPPSSLSGPTGPCSGPGLPPPLWLVPPAAVSPLFTAVTPLTLWK